MIASAYPCFPGFDFYFGFDFGFGFGFDFGFDFDFDGFWKCGSGAYQARVRAAPERQVAVLFLKPGLQGRGFRPVYLHCISGPVNLKGR
ncbi:hypothetical protein [Methanosarcina sp. KYL-1]|uniref:hypothetical protein n=1 Tax=Methanosarcina sp. KYL-1 TaxID=2602068 RepID=UPI0021018F4C|nr:hypothetical protein [Methanosarcina sp. KYL-1]